MPVNLKHKRERQTAQSGLIVPLPPAVKRALYSQARFRYERTTQFHLLIKKEVILGDDDKIMRLMLMLMLMLIHQFKFEKKDSCTEYPSLNPRET